jgi:hypothetical protein
MADFPSQMSAYGRWKLRDQREAVMGSNWPTAIVPTGQVEYTAPGTYSWTAPTNVTSVCVVCVGGGASGGASSNTYMYAGGGGGLGYKNNIAVTPGNSYTVVVGAGGAAVAVAAGSTNGNNGGDSYFINTSTVKGGGGNGTTGAGGTYTGDGGGNGGNGGHDASGYGSGGGGAGGYAGNGGNGMYSAGSGGTNGSGGSGGGGANCSTGDIGAGGGGVGIYGQGTSGSVGTYGTTATGGTGGSGGGPGGYGYTSGRTITGIGNSFGGGSGSVNHVGNNVPAVTSSGAGGGGAVRIIWGTGRSFPSTLAADLDPAGATTFKYWRMLEIGSSWSKLGTSYDYNQVYTFSLFTATNATGTDLALSGTASASSIYNGSYPASYANDGNSSTAWSSLNTSDLWLQITFGTAQSVHSSSILWWGQSAGYCPKFYKIQFSPDNTNWYNVASGGTLDDNSASATTTQTNF